MTEVSVKKVLRTIKFSNKLENHHHPIATPKCGLTSTLRTPREKSFLMMTDVTHKKSLAFPDGFFPSIKKNQLHLQPMKKKTEKTPDSIKKPNELANLDSMKELEEKPKKAKFMSKKKNLVISEFIQFEEEEKNMENKENSNCFGLEEEIREKLVNKHVMHLEKNNGCPMTMASIIRHKNMTPKFNPNLMSKNIFNIPDIKLRKLAIENHFQSYKSNKALDKANELKNNIIYQLGEGSNILSCCYDFDDYYVAYGSDDSIIRVYKTSVNKIACCFSDAENYGVPITCLKFKPITVDNILLSARVNGVISIWNIEKNHMISRFKEENYVYTSEYNRDGTKFATAGYDTKIRVYDQNTLALSSIFQKDDKNNDYLGHTNRIYSLKYWSDHPEVLLSAGWDETLFIWDTRVGRHIEYIYGPLVCGDSLDIKGDNILTGSWRDHNQLQIWDIRNKKTSFDIPWENYNTDNKNDRSHIYVSQFNKASDRYIIAGTTGNNEIRIFDKNENYRCVDVISGFEKPVYTLSFNHVDQKIAFGSGNGLCGVIEV